MEVRQAMAHSVPPSVQPAFVSPANCSRATSTPVTSMGPAAGAVGTLTSNLTQTYMATALVCAPATANVLPGNVPQAFVFPAYGPPPYTPPPPPPPRDPNQPPSSPVTPGVPVTLVTPALPSAPIATPESPVSSTPASPTTPAPTTTTPTTPVTPSAPETAPETTPETPAPETPAAQKHVTIVAPRPTYRTVQGRHRLLRDIRSVHS